MTTLDAPSMTGFASSTAVGEALLDLTQTLLVASQAKGSQCRRVGRALLLQLQKPNVFARLDASVADAILLQLAEGYRLSLPGVDRDAYCDCLLSVPLDARSIVAYMQHTVALASDEPEHKPNKSAKRAKRKSKGTSSSDGSDPGVSESSLGSTTEATVSTGLMQLTMMLELLNGKALGSVTDASSLVRPLFDLLVLYAQLTAEARTACEASVQAVVQLLARLTQECDPTELDEGDTQVSPLLNILRGTSNPQTHNVVLVLLGHIARIKPHDVVSNSIPLFAFMGSHSVKKADDVYTFGVFKRTLQAIIAAVLDSKDGNRYTVIAEVCDVFASSFAAIPSHRRAALYTHLATCLATPAHLFLLCMALLKADVTNDARERAPDGAVADLTASSDDGRKVGSDVPELVLSLCNLLDVESHFTILLLMIELVGQLPVCHTSRSNKRWRCASKTVSGLDLGLVFDVATYPARQLRHLRYLTVRQLSSHLSASTTLRQLVIAQEDDEANTARNLILSMSESALGLTAALRRQAQEAKRMNAADEERQSKAKARGPKSPAPRPAVNAGSPKYWSQVTTDAYLALYRTNALLSTADFADVIKRLVVSADVVVRKKALDMLATRLEKRATKRDAMVQDETEEEISATVMSLVPVLLKVLPNPLGSEATSIENSARDFASGRGIQQGIVHALTAIVKVYGAEQPELSLSVVPAVFSLFDKSEASLDYELVSTCLACLGVVVIKVGAAFLPHLNMIVAQLLGLYEQVKTVCFEADDEDEDEDEMTDEQDESKAQLRSRALILLKAVIDVKGCLIAALPTFLSPFLPKMLPCLCHPALTGSSFYRPLPDSVTQRAATVRRSLTLRVAARLVVPAVDTCLVGLLREDKVETGDTIHCTLILLRDRVAEAELGDVKGQFKVLFKLAQRVFGYRFSCLSKSDPSQLHHRVVQVEQAMVEVLAAIVLKMSDVLFRPLFLQLVDWALQQPEQRRLIPLFRLVKHLVTTLRQFFVPYFSHLLRTAVEVLSDDGEHSIHYGTDFGMLQHLVMTSMGACFKYDEEEFMTAERFEALVQPLVDQLNNEHEEEASYLARAQNDVVPTLTEFMANTRDNKLWKKLNEAVRLPSWRFECAH
jgi:U3 small nucleolar RNA-associated protein 10